MRPNSLWLPFALLLGLSGNAAAAVLFSDDFQDPATTAVNWSNDRGAWAAASGVYNAGAPSNAPVTYTDVNSLSSLTDFRVEVDVNSLDDGGIWLRSSFGGGGASGILLVTGGLGGAGGGLYWHVITNDSASAIMSPGGSGLDGDNVRIRVDVVGNTYSAYADNVLITQLVDNTFASGSAGLYDFSVAQTFDNFVVSDSAASSVPEPASLALLAGGLLGFGVLRRRARRA
jgi:hypothetical protein